MHVSYPQPRWRIPVLPASLVGLATLAGVFVWSSTREPLPQPGNIVVSVVGHVEQAGLATLAPDARVADALDHARPLADADLLTLNLAQKLADGQQIVVPAPHTAPASAGKLSLNAATAAQLEELDGIGPATAAAIIAYRDSHGGFATVEQLQEVQGIGPAKFASISPQVVP